MRLEASMVLAPLLFDHHNPFMSYLFHFKALAGDLAPFRFYSVLCMFSMEFGEPLRSCSIPSSDLSLCIFPTSMVSFISFTG